MFRQVALLTMLACNHTRTQDVIRHENRMFTASVRNLLYMHGHYNIMSSISNLLTLFLHSLFDMNEKLMENQNGR